MVICPGNMQMPQILNEFAWLVHVGILDGVFGSSHFRPSQLQSSLLKLHVSKFN